MSFACSFIFMQVKVIFKRMVSHLDSLWSRSTRELGNGLFNICTVHVNQVEDVLGPCKQGWMEGVWFSINRISFALKEQLCCSKKMVELSREWSRNSWQYWDAWYEVGICAGFECWSEGGAWQAATVRHGAAARMAAQNLLAAAQQWHWTPTWTTCAVSAVLQCTARPAPIGAHKLRESWQGVTSTSEQHQSTSQKLYLTNWRGSNGISITGNSFWIG